MSDKTVEQLATEVKAAHAKALDEVKAVAEQAVAEAKRGIEMPEVSSVTPGPGSLTVVIHNDHATAALNGTLQVGFFTLKR
ncbi:MAG: hypothetical protein ACYDD1_17925 [Caulobacteraceae bacterium]